ncbi:MAG: sigma-70 family RNA polymerase sigma factor [Solirubrobacteraceae bacterium]|nr:sigma-70 family RNA polymerase sigma factor [Solirubrobacteraceae bacterium]
METSAEHRFRTLVEPYLPEIRAFAARRAPAIADDVLSEVSVVAWRRIDDLPSGNERAWLYGVARNVLLTEHRKAARRESARSDIELSEIADPASSQSWHPPLAEALDRLSSRDRDLLLLTAWEGLSTAEVASVLQIRPTAARMGLVRARRRLAAALDDLDPGWSGTALPQHIGPTPSHRQAAQEVPSCADAKH